MDTRIKQITHGALGESTRWLNLDRDVSELTKNKIILAAMAVTAAHGNCDDGSAGEEVAALDRLLTTMWAENAWDHDPDERSPLTGLISLEEAAILTAGEQKKSGQKFHPMAQAVALLETVAEVESSLTTRQLAVFLGIAGVLLNEGMEGDRK